MSLQDLIAPKTSADMLAEELSNAASEGLETTTWQPGSVIRTLMAIMAATYSMFSQIIVVPIQGGFGDLLSTIDWARVWAKQFYNVDAILAQPATGFVDFTNTSATVYTYAAGDVILAHADTGKLYRNDAGITIPATGTLSSVAITSTEVGTVTNAAPGKITVIVGPSMNGVTVTNPLAVLGANDETVDALVTRAREKLSSLSPDGPKEAYNYVAKSSEFSATSTPITRSSTVADPLTGDISVYIATAAGAPISGDVAIVQAAIDHWAEPWCNNATAIAASNVTVNVTYEIWVKSKLSTTAIETAIASALATFFSDPTLNPIGGLIIPPATTGTVYVDSIATAIVETPNIGAIRVSVTLPTADTAITVGQVAVLGTITPMVNFL